MKPRFALAIALKHGTFEELMKLKERYAWLINQGGLLLVKPSIDLVPTTLVDGLHVVLGNDGTLYRAWNTVLKYISERRLLNERDLLAFAGDDDEVQPAFVTKVLERQGSDAYFADYIKTYGDRQRRIQVNEHPLLFGKSKIQFDLAHPGLAIRWGCYNRRLFDEALELAGDLEILVAMQQEGALQYQKIDGIQVACGAEGMSNSASAFERYVKEWRYIKRKYGNDTICVPLLKFRALAVLIPNSLTLRILRSVRWRFGDVAK